MKRFLKDQSGATAIEYCFIAATVGVVLVAVTPKLAGHFTVKFSSLDSHITLGK